MKSDLVDISVQFQHQTEAAVCVRVVESGPDIWVPKSRCEILQTDPRRGHYILLTTDEATATEKGLIQRTIFQRAVWKVADTLISGTRLRSVRPRNDIGCRDSETASPSPKGMGLHNRCYPVGAGYGGWNGCPLSNQKVKTRRRHTPIVRIAGVAPGPSEKWFATHTEKDQ